MNSVSCIVPARIGSTRFPRKPLVKIRGKEMVVRTLEQASLANCFDRIICATDSEEIGKVVSQNGFEYVLTGKANTGTDRVSIAAKILNLDLVVNLQGDEPIVEPKLLGQVAKTLEKNPENWISVATPLKREEAENKTIVKVLIQNGFAKDFCRIIPSSDFSRWKKHQGIYAYSQKSRDEFFSLPRNSIEIDRSLEQMRIIHIRPIQMILSPYHSISVDVPLDVKNVEDFLDKQSSQKITDEAQKNISTIL